MEVRNEIPPIAYWLWLTTREGLGLKHQYRLLTLFGSPKEIYSAPAAQIRKLTFLDVQQQTGLSDKSMDPVRKILKDCRHLQVRICALDDPAYPERLRNIYQPPLVLYQQGREIDFDQWVAIAMAGTRSCSEYGRRMADKMAWEITRQGGLVVTGVVPGCDYAAATAALRAGGPVVCVLAGGVDVPFDHYSPGLYQAVRENGVLITEYPPGTPHRGRQFPVRNRILTGLCLGTLCVEGSFRSGTMKVADLALEQGRDLYVVPANADTPQGAGMINLLKQGCAPVTRGWEILEGYRYRYGDRIHRQEPEKAASAEQVQVPEIPEDWKEPEIEPLPEEKAVDNNENLAYIDLDAQKSAYTDEERAILRALQGSPRTVDDLVAETDIPARRVFSALTILTIRQLVVEEEGGRYRATVRVNPA